MQSSTFSFFCTFILHLYIYLLKAEQHYYFHFENICTVLCCSSQTKYYTANINLLPIVFQFKQNCFQNCPNGLKHQYSHPFNQIKRLESSSESCRMNLVWIKVCKNAAKKEEFLIICRIQFGKKYRLQICIFVKSLIQFQYLSYPHQRLVNLAQNYSRVIVF